MAIHRWKYGESERVLETGPTGVEIMETRLEGESRSRKRKFSRLPSGPFNFPQCFLTLAKFIPVNCKDNEITEQARITTMQFIYLIYILKRKCSTNTFWNLWLQSYRKKIFFKNN